MFRSFAAVALALVSSLAAQTALAQGFPSKPTKIIVPFPAGGLLDGVARITSAKLAETSRQTVLVENKPGAGGTLGAAAAATAAADGQTILLVLDTHAINHHLYAKLTYDPFKSFEHVTQLLSSPQLIAATLNFQPSSLKELIAYAKSKPGELSYGSIGTGSANHLNALLLEQHAGIKMLHIPYKGGAPMLQDLIGGQINISFVAAPSTIGHIKGGRMKALAAGTPQRLPQLPDTPTIGETIPGFVAASWIGVLVPTGTPKPLIGDIHAAYAKVMADADVKAKLTAQGFDIVGSSPEQFLGFVREQSDKLGKVIRDNGIKVE